MTNSMRWSLTSLTALGLMVAVGAFVGCSSSSSNPPADSGTGEDSAVDSTPEDSTPADSTPEDSATDSTADAADTGPIVPDRKITLVHASPDAGDQFFCFGAGVNKTLAKALLIGIPDPTAPSDTTKYSPFPYGAIVPLTFPNDKVTPDLISALESLTIYAWPIGSTNPTSATVDEATACTNAWNAVKADATKYIEVPSHTVLANTSTLMYATGCAVATDVNTLPQCGGHALNLTYKVLDLTAPTFPADDAGTATNVAFHFFNASGFNTVTSPTTIPGWQAVDIYLQGIDASGNDTGTAQKIADNVSYGDIVSPAMPFQLPADADKTKTVIEIVPHGASACHNASPAPTATCPAWTMPTDTAQATFKDFGGGFFNNTNQLLLLAGAPIPDAATGMPRIGFGNVSKP